MRVETPSKQQLMILFYIITFGYARHGETEKFLTIPTVLDAFSVDDMPYTRHLEMHQDTFVDCSFPYTTFSRYREGEFRTIYFSITRYTSCIDFIQDGDSEQDIFDENGYPIVKTSNL